jgi:hypothetical protein
MVSYSGVIEKFFVGYIFLSHSEYHLSLVETEEGKREDSWSRL